MPNLPGAASMQRRLPQTPRRQREKRAVRRLSGLLPVHLAVHESDARFNPDAALADGVDGDVDQ